MSEKEHPINPLEVVSSSEKEGDVLTSEWYSHGRAAKILGFDSHSLNNEIQQTHEFPPDGWVTFGRFVRTLPVGRNLIAKITNKYRITNPEWFGKFVTTKNTIEEHVSPELVISVVSQIETRPPKAPDGWMTPTKLTWALGSSLRVIFLKLEKYRLSNPEWFRDYLDGAGNISEHLHPDLIAAITKEMENRETLAPSGWKTAKALAKILGVDKKTIVLRSKKYKLSNPEWFVAYRSAIGRKAGEHMHPALVEIVSSDIAQREELPDARWKTMTQLADELEVSEGLVISVAEGYRKTNPEWFHNYLDKTKKSTEYFHPDLTSKILEDLSGRGEEAPPGWYSVGSICTSRGWSRAKLVEYRTEYRKTNPEWFKNYIDKHNQIREHLSPTLISILESKNLSPSFTKEDQSKNKQIYEELEKFVKDVVSSHSEAAESLRQLIKIFGSSRCVDILFKFRPEFRGLPIEHVRKVIGEYLGDFLVQKGGFSLYGVTIEKEYLSDQTLRQGLFENIKDNCLRYYYQEKRRTPDLDPLKIIYDYIEHVSDSLGEHRTNEIDDVVQDVIQYYDEALRQFKKPERFVDSLSQNREFPDINQKINMKELADKKRLLIADEMGLGKSASVIMAKENLGIRCAIVAAPANVIDTWLVYLSDKPGGYFKAGEAPKVVIATTETLPTIEPGSCDYILISHESLKDRQVDELKRIGFDMLVVDEAHKVSNVKGARTEQLTRLSQEIEGDNKYLALLTGTPAQNKVKDLATSLRLLYPERFADTPDSALVNMIVNGDVIDLRSLLLPRLQMKELRDMLEMPKVIEENEYIELSPDEKEISEAIIEEDELTASEKMHALRRVVLNPELLDMTPGIESSKTKALEKTIKNSLEKRNRILVFVNDYVEGLLRGDNAMVNKLNLPQDTLVRVVHGQTEDRRSIQNEFNKPDEKKIVLFVGGQTGDVGVDYTGAEHVIFYNEPWTEFKKRQEFSRADRPGQIHELVSTTLIAKGSIEEGINEYKARKLKAIEKILKGVPLSELEETILLQPEPGDQNKEVNAELAEYFFSSWNKLMRMFGYIKEIGEDKFAKFLLDHASEYAHVYGELGNRSYQSNANRVTATLIQREVENSQLLPADVRILDLDSGPEMLKRHIGTAYKKRVLSMDLNIHHFKGDGENRIVGSHLNIPMTDEAFDFVNFSLSWHYTKFVPSKGEYERVRVLSEINRVLKIGGKAFINMIYSLQLKDMDAFSLVAEKVGFKVVAELTGTVDGSQNYESTLITLEKVQNSELDAKKLVDQFDAEEIRSLKFEKNDRKLKSSRSIIQEFTLNDKEISVDLTNEDKAVLAEERAILEAGRYLKEKHGSIAKIPVSEITGHKFSRILIGKKYLLFKKLSNHNGSVIIK